MKEYQYDKKMFLWKVTIPAVFTSFLLVACLSIAVFYAQYRLLLGFISLVCVYVVWNTAVTHSYPSKVVIDGASISFCAYGGRQTYPLEQIRQLRVRESFYSKSMFIRINDPVFGKGRFWLDADYFNQGEELQKFILALERQLHPTSIKAMARNGKGASSH